MALLFLYKLGVVEQNYGVAAVSRRNRFKNLPDLVRFLFILFWEWLANMDASFWNWESFVGERFLGDIILVFETFMLKWIILGNPALWLPKDRSRLSRRAPSIPASGQGGNRKEKFHPSARPSSKRLNIRSLVLKLILIPYHFHVFSRTSIFTRIHTETQ